MSVRILASVLIATLQLQLQLLLPLHEKQDFHERIATHLKVFAIIRSLANVNINRDANNMTAVIK